MLGTFCNWVEIVGRTLAEEGIDLSARLEALGQGQIGSSAGGSRLDPKLSKTIWRVVEDSTADPVFGLSMLRGLDFHDFEDLGVALVASGTAEAAVQRIVRYHGLISDRLALGRYRAHESAGMADRFDELLRARERELARATSTVGAVRHALVSTMGKDAPSLERVAASMHVSERTLQRRLADEGSSFAQILDATRRELAGSWLAEKQLSRTEIAYLLGFAHPSSFSRALRRWEEDR